LAGEVLFDDSYHGEERQQAAEDEFEDAKPLAEELIDTLIDMLFFADFTLPRAPTGKNKVTYAIWQSGVGCNTPIGTSKEFESNRCEILRLLLTLTSKVYYIHAHPKITTADEILVNVHECECLASTGCKDNYIYSYLSRQASSSLCSLFFAKYCQSLKYYFHRTLLIITQTLKYNPASWRVPYNPVVSKDPKQVLVTYALQFLLVILVYPIPEMGPASMQKNYYRHL
jgi:hypothetical protein